MNIYTIYKATNLINGKIYIGFDSRWPNRKWSHHTTAFSINSIEYNNYFHNAIRKYGKENFLWEPIYQSLDKIHTLQDMEPYFIKEYNTYNSNQGYNLTMGGVGCSGWQYTKNINRQTPTWTDERRLEQSNRMILFNPMQNKHIKEKARLNNIISWTPKRRNQASLNKVGVNNITENGYESLRKRWKGVARPKTPEHILNNKKSRQKFWYITPFGKFMSAQDAANLDTISLQTIMNRCYNPDKLISKKELRILI